MLDTVSCPVCRLPLAPGSTICAACGEDLVALVHLHARSRLLYNDGLRLAQAGDLEGARLALHQAIALADTNVDAQAVLGKLHAQDGRLSEARLLWQNVLDRDPEHASARAGLARLDELDRAAAEASHREAADRAAEADRTKTAATRWRLIVASAGFMLGALALLLVQQVWARGPGPADSTAAVPPAATTVPATPTTSPPPAAVATSPAAPPAAAPPVAVAVAAPPTTAPSPVAVVAAPVAAVAPSPAVVAPPALPVASAASPAPTATADLRGPVEAALRSDPRMAGLELRVEQRGSTIRLIGQAPSLLARYTAEMVARSAPGVEAVDLQDVAIIQTHVVQSGDSLWTISIRYYGVPDRRGAIAAANGLGPQSALLVGQQLVIPLP